MPSGFGRYHHVHRLSSIPGWRTMSPPAQKVRHGVVAPLELRDKRDKRDKRGKRGKSSLALTFPRLSRFSRSIAGGKPAFVRSPTLYAEQIEWVSVWTSSPEGRRSRGYSSPPHVSPRSFP